MAKIFESWKRFVRWCQVSSITRQGGGGEISGALLIRALKEHEQRSSQ